MTRTATALAVLAPLLLLWACNTPTPYQPLASGNPVSGGYTDQMLDDTHFRVTFSGNDMTSRQQVETYLLYRAAELTTAKGFDWFEIADRQTQNTSQTFVDPGPWGYWRPSWRFYRHGGWYGGDWMDPWGTIDVDTIDQYSATAEVVVGHGPKPANDPRAFDAHQVLQNLDGKIVRQGEAAPAH
jgi:hypothetical protein